MEELTRTQQQIWKKRLTKESLHALLCAGFELQTDFYEVPVLGVMALKGFPYRNIREVLAALYYGAKYHARESGVNEWDIDKQFYRQHPQLRLCPGDRREVLAKLGCFERPERFYDLTIQQLLSAVYFDPPYIAEYAQYYVRFFERKKLGDRFCFEDRMDILKRYRPFFSR